MFKQFQIALLLKNDINYKRDQEIIIYDYLLNMTRNYCIFLKKTIHLFIVYTVAGIFFSIVANKDYVTKRFQDLYRFFSLSLYIVYLKRSLHVTASENWLKNILR